MTPPANQVHVIGAGPAGLMAAERLAQAGLRVVVHERTPSVARKLLMAGRGGLNLTHSEPLEAFVGRYGDARNTVAGWLDVFSPADLVAWVQGLGQPTFVGSSGRVFPKAMKASPLLRAWLARLREGGVEMRTRWRWTGGRFQFETPQGPQEIASRVAVLALGGASWPRLGSDAAWVPWLEAEGVTVAPFRPANMGFHVAWSPQMARHVGSAVKGTALRAGGQVSRGEWIIGATGIEGGGVYEISAALRDGAAGHVDLAPDLDARALTARFARPRDRLSLGNWLRRVLDDPVKVALLLEWGRPLPVDAAGWAALAKALPLRHAGPMGLERAISSAGGISWDALTTDHELAAMPDVFAAGEMLDWEAPTGGYLLTACLGSGRSAGRAAAARLVALGQR